MSDSFWRKAYRSLPDQVRWRYANLFEAAERYDALLDRVVDSGGRALRALRKTPRITVGTARRPTLTR